MNKIDWIGEKECKVGDVLFRVETGDSLYAAASGVESFVIGKSRRQLDTLQKLFHVESIRRICEIGIYKGGSVVFNHELFQPELILALDIEKKPVAQLEDFIQARGLTDRIRTFYGVDQSDKAAVGAILEREMGDTKFDLVVDDGSHWLHETKEAFNMLFPYLAVGGHYVIEDWGWAHWPGDLWQKDGGIWKDKPPLTNLIFELVMSLASSNGLVESVYLLPAYAVVKRAINPRGCEKNEFDISKCILNRGKHVKLLT